MSPCSARKATPWLAPCCSECAGSQAMQAGSLGGPSGDMHEVATVGAAVAGGVVFYALARKTGPAVRALFALGGVYVGYRLGSGL
jgi:hypothetical protein